MIHRRVSAIAITMAVGAALVAGCASESKSSSISGSIQVGTGKLSLSEVPAEQLGALGDGHVTVEEYSHAFDAFSTCASNANQSLQDVKHDAATGLISYATRQAQEAPGPISGNPLNQCYQRYFSYVELVWQATDPNFRDSQIRKELESYEQTVKPCLVVNGIEAPNIVTPGTPEYSDLLHQVATLTNEGKC